MCVCVHRILCLLYYNIICCITIYCIYSTEMYWYAHIITCYYIIINIVT